MDNNKENVEKELNEKINCLIRDMPDIGNKLKERGHLLIDNPDEIENMFEGIAEKLIEIIKDPFSNDDQQSHFLSFSLWNDYHKFRRIAVFPKDYKENEKFKAQIHYLEDEKNEIVFLTEFLYERFNDKKIIVINGEINDNSKIEYIQIDDSVPCFPEVICSNDGSISFDPEPLSNKQLQLNEMVHYKKDFVENNYGSDPNNTDEKIKRQLVYFYSLQKWTLGCSPTIMLVPYTGWIKENIGAILIMFKKESIPKDCFSNFLNYLQIIANRIYGELVSFFYNKIIIDKSVQAAIVAIMSRNGSHNLGSHVIFNVIKDIDKLNVQANKHLFKYLQQRMDFLAQISTAWVPDWTSPSWLIKEIMKGFLEQEHILNYIARAEGLQAKPEKAKIRKISKFILRQKKKDGGYKREIIIQMDIGTEDSSDEDTNQGQDNMGLDKDFLIAIPGSNIGFHALYTIIENFIRNAAKHEFSALPLQYQKQKSLKVNLEIEENDDGKSYTVKLWDNLSYLSTNLDDSKVDDEQFLGEVSLKDKDLKKLKFEKVLEGNETKEASETGPKGPEYKAKIITVILEDDGIKIQIDGKDELKQELHNLFTEINSKHRVFIVHPYDEYNGFKRPMKLEKFQEMMGKPNVRFISEPRWSGFLDVLDWPKGDDDEKQKRIKRNIIKQKLVKLLQDAWQPTHKKLNSDLKKELINKEGNLMRENWGLSEMKICAGYLQKEKISTVGQGGKDVLGIIKVVSVPEYIKRIDSTEGIRAYRMGYQFKLYKPKEVLVVGFNDFKGKTNLERQSIYIRQDFGESDDFDFDFVVIAGNAVEEFVNRLSNSDKHKFIETFPYRIVLVSNKNISIIDEDDFLKKRVSVCNEKVLIGENSGLAKHLENCAKNNKNSAKELSNAEEFKLKVYEAWVKHIKENVRGLKDEIYVVVKPTGGSIETDGSDLSKFLCMLDKMLVETEGSKLKLNDDEKIILHEKCEKALREHFGFYKKNYQPATLPDPPFSKDASGDEGKIFAYSFKNCLGNDLKWPDDFTDKDKHKKTISYIRHAHLCTQTDCSKNHTPIYDEKTGGGGSSLSYSFQYSFYGGKTILAYNHYFEAYRKWSSEDCNS